MCNSRLLTTVLVLGLCASTAAAEDVATRHITVNVTMAPRISLKVSSQVLQFDVTQPGAVATAAVEFTAGARMASGSAVVLTVEPWQGLDGPGGAADVETALSFVGEGDGMLAGSVAMAESTIVGRWQGSGRREGRVIFKLRANAAGNYVLPVRFVLSTP
jgi:hypothetical protein